METDPLAVATLQRVMTVLAAVGTVLMVMGGWVAFTSDAASYPRSMRAYYCEGGHESELIPPLLWVIWLAVVGAAVAGVAIALRLGRAHRRTTVLAVLGAVSAVAACPVWLPMLVGMDCGL